MIRYWLESVTDNGPVVNDFIDWCERSLLNINVSKTNEMITDFRKKPPLISSVFVHGQTVEVVQQYKYLGTIIDTSSCLKPKLMIFAQSPTSICIFIVSWEVSVWTPLLWNCFILVLLSCSNFYCWFGSLTLKNKNRLEQIELCGKIAGKNLSEFSFIYRAKATKIAQSILADHGHQCSVSVNWLPSGRRYGAKV